MPPPQSSADFYSILQRHQMMLVVAGRRLWRGMAPDAMDASWQQVGPQLVAFAAGAQLSAARSADEYVPAVLAEQGISAEPLVRVRPQAFSGVASDGRSLLGLLEGAVVNSKRAVTRGLDGGDALANGQRWLEMALQTTVTDAARDATAANIVARPHVGWVRMVNPPCCSRCAVLAGRIYKWSDGFLRHPRCDCTHIPTTIADAQDLLTSPQALVSRGLITDLSKGQRKRLDDGADLVKVLNESRDAWRARLTADRQAAKTSGSSGWAGGTSLPPVGTTIHELMARLTDQVQAASAMRAAGIAT